MIRIDFSKISQLCLLKPTNMINSSNIYLLTPDRAGITNAKPRRCKPHNWFFILIDRFIILAHSFVCKCAVRDLFVSFVSKLTIKHRKIEDAKADSISVWDAEPLVNFLDLLVSGWEKVWANKIKRNQEICLKMGLFQSDDILLKCWKKYDKHVKTFKTKIKCPKNSKMPASINLNIRTLGDKNFLF